MNNNTASTSVLHRLACSAMLGFASSAPMAPSASAQGVSPLPPLHSVQVTATQFGEPVGEVPGSISVVSGDEIRARGATDLRTALALLGGVSVAPGGDAGPASAVPGLLGVREVDDLLLLIDGIPAGGAFVPQVEAVSLNNVERIEVLRGAAPVYYGSTAFAGTINVIHYPAGRADSNLSLRYGSRGTLGVSAAAVLSTGVVRQSVSAELSDDRLSDRRAGFKRAQGSWRLATEIGGGSARADVNLLALRQKPTSPSPVDPDTGKLTSVLPLDFNQNPVNSRLDTDRAQLVLGYEVPLPIAGNAGRWVSTLATTRSNVESVRGFFDIADLPDPIDASAAADTNGFKQSRRLHDLFIDSHLTTRPMAWLDVTAGVNLLLGRASQHSLRYGYDLPLDGSSAPIIESTRLKGRVDLQDDRRFVGVYAQSRVALSSSASLLGGLRWNATHESRSETRARVNAAGVTTNASQNVDRPSGSLGARWQAWHGASGPIDALTLHASLGNTFQPAQVDFGVEPEAAREGGGLLKPETQRSLVFGIKADALQGRAEFDIDGFIVDFDNQPVQASASDGSAVLRAGGRQRFNGIESEAALRPAPGWTVKASAAWADARYRSFVTDVDGTPTQLAGKRQVLTPRLRAAAGLLYAPERGWRGSITSSWTGQHWLDRVNTQQAPGYAVTDASVGYRFERMTLSARVANLGNRRDPVQLSELGEEQFYRLPARHLEVALRVPFD